MDYLFLIFLFVLILQRLSELMYARKNEKIMKEKGAIEYDSRGYSVIVVMHVLFFVSLIAEKVYMERSYNSLSLIFLTLFLGAQFLRYWAISTLGTFWNTRIIVLPGSEPVRKGPYRYLKHPNYIAVAIELAVIPLIFSCYITAVTFSIINLILLRRRIETEENVLKLNR